LKIDKQLAILQHVDSEFFYISLRRPWRSVVTCLSVCLSVCVFVTQVIPAKTVEPIELPLRVGGLSLSQGSTC